MSFLFLSWSRLIQGSFCLLYLGSFNFGFRFQITWIWFGFVLFWSLMFLFDFVISLILFFLKLLLIRGYLGFLSIFFFQKFRRHIESNVGEKFIFTPLKFNLIQNFQKQFVMRTVFLNNILKDLINLFCCFI